MIALKNIGGVDNEYYYFCCGYPSSFVGVYIPHCRRFSTLLRLVKVSVDGFSPIIITSEFHSFVTSACLQVLVSHGKAS